MIALQSLKLEQIGLRASFPFKEFLIMLNLPTVFS